jgi:rubrerythrin
MKWVCDICGYEIEQDEKPEVDCAVCGVDASHWVEG